LNNKGVSEVTATILMVTITVVLAAVLYIMISGDDKMTLVMYKGGFIGGTKTQLALDLMMLKSIGYLTHEIDDGKNELLYLE